MNTKIISCLGSKGGIGKSTLNLLMASFFHYVKGLKVLFIDLDNPQYSIYRKRLRDLQKWDISEEEKDNLYLIVRCHVNDLKENIAAHFGKVDIIIIDFPGSMTKELALGLYYLDYVFTPFNIDEFEIDETITFYKSLIKHYRNHEKARLKDNYVFFNRFEKTQSNEFLDNKIELLEAGVKMLKSIVLKRKKYTKEYRNTLFSIPDNKENTMEGIKTFFEEVLTIIDK